MLIPDPLRQTGRTTQAVINSPNSALYVCSHGTEISVARKIAKETKRGDLSFCSVKELFKKDLHKDHKCIVFDHSVSLISFNIS